ncbi:alpha/beta hydrolase [Fictibacillus phosphorivorans]|uniref:alpha/beta hydrolase n=1 Tax=Fictibacillus phosphorivorans TaxID=1221500 RepID=UPI002040DB9C|nr:alpha/beta hydrolase [Fictibacillus phosphorivorans]MCM3775464.1 alpha/beta hydrolase [Fictibacillus phosphorivorans]
MWTWRTDQEAKGTVVVVHGANEHHGRYDWVIKKLNEVGFHCVSGDLPGQGTTTRRRGHIDTFDEYIFTIENWYLEAEKLGLPVYLLGHSMGGLAVIRTLMEKRLPVCAVVLSSPCLGLAYYPSKGKELLSLLLNKIAPGVRFPANLPEGGVTRNEEIRVRDKEDKLIVKKVSVRWYRELKASIKYAFEQYSSLPNIPLLLLQAGDDLIVDKIAVKRWFNGISLEEKWYKEFPSLYHEVLNEPERENVFEYVKSFLYLHSEANNGKR